MNNDSARGRDAAIDVENGGMQTLFALETEVAVGNLDGDGNEDRVGGDAKEIRAVFQVNLTVNDA